MPRLEKCVSPPSLAVYLLAIGHEDRHRIVVGKVSADILLILQNRFFETEDIVLAVHAI
jgi:hypothetical protein